MDRIKNPFLTSSAGNNCKECSHAIFLILIITVILMGCGGDDSSLKEVVPVANFVSATPPGGEIAANGTITVTFDNPPFDVTVSAGTVTVRGKTATIVGPFTPGPLSLTITWHSGSQTLNYLP